MRREYNIVWFSLIVLISESSSGGVLYEDIQIEKMKNSNFPVPLLTPEDILSKYKQVVVGGSEELKQWSDNVYVLTLFRTLCEMEKSSPLNPKCFLLSGDRQPESISLALDLIRDMMKKSSLFGFSTYREFHDQLSIIAKDVNLQQPAHMVHAAPSKRVWTNKGVEKVPREVFNLVQGIEETIGRLQRLGDWISRPEIQLVTVGKMVYQYPNRIAMSYGLSRPVMTIQYLASCVDANGENQINDIFFMELLQNFEISPKIYYYSDRMERVPGRDGKVPITTLACNTRASPPISVRYMIRESVGQSLKDYAHTPQSLRQAMVAGIQLITKLKILHSRNIIHGNLLWENIFITHDNLDVRLMDFAHAKLIAYRDEFCEQPSYLPKVDDCVVSFSDEVFLAVMASIDIAYGGSVRKFFDDDSVDEERKQELRKSGQILDIRESYGMQWSNGKALTLDSILPSIDERTKADIREQFKIISDEIERVKLRSERPDYDNIIRAYERVREILRVAAVN